MFVVVYVLVIDLILGFSFDFVMWFLDTCFDLRFYFGWCLLVGIMALIILVLFASVGVVLYWFAFTMIGLYCIIVFVVFCVRLFVRCV